MTTRRHFITGLCAAVVTGRVRAEDRRRAPRAFEFRPYTATPTLAPVTCVTPDDGFYIHTFFDVCPFSPSQRYLAVLRLPVQDRLPTWEDTADVCVIDLEERTIRTVYTTSAFGMQTGAHVQWGRTDRHLYFNDKSEKAGGHAVAIRLDWQGGTARELGGPVYHVAPDESAVISYNLDLINWSQDGYGCVVTPDRRLTPAPGAPEDQGLWHTDIRTGRPRLLVSLAAIFEAIPDKDLVAGHSLLLFHAKYNPQGTRIMQVVRSREPDMEPGRIRRRMLVTFNADGSDIRVAVPDALWSRGGHHPNWTPDGRRILMNLKPEDKLRFCTFNHDGSDFRVIGNDLLGSGHPAYETTGRFIFTDTYPHEPMATPDGSSAMRLIDTNRNEEKTVLNIFALGRINPSVLRCDPHPAWSRDGLKSCFNGAPDGRRQVYVADLSGLLAAGGAVAASAGA